MPDDQKCIEPNEVYRLLALPDHLILSSREKAYLYIHSSLSAGSCPSLGCRRSTLGLGQFPSSDGTPNTPTSSDYL